MVQPVSLAVLLTYLCCRDVLGISGEFRQYLDAHSKQYSAAELTRRFSIWTTNKAMIDQHNTEALNGQHTYTMAVNEFTDMTQEEYREKMLTKFPTSDSPTSSYMIDTPQTELPASVDWNAKGYVTEVGNQGQCGSCWAFTATGALEGQHKKATGELVDLSEQDLMDCSTKQGNNGCSGGYMTYSFEYVKENGGIDTEESYPYSMTSPGTQKCRYDVANRGATCTGFVNLPKGNEHSLQMAVAHIGPIAVAVDASHSGFSFYKSGVYSNPKDCSSTIVDHTLLITGYGVENGTEYWECKNSWGTSWGNQGYIRMSRNKDNQCGIASIASYPTV